MNDTHEATIRRALDTAGRQTSELVEFGKHYAATRPKFERRFGDRAWNAYLGDAYRATDALVAERDRFEVALMIACADAVGPEIGADKMVAEYDRLLALAAEREST